MKPLRQDFSKPDIEQSLPLRELATLIAVAQMGSASKAAEALGYAQSTVSLHVHVLERYLAVALFERNGRRLALTPAGRMAVDRGAALLDQARAFRAIVRARGDEVTGSVAIASVEPTATHRLPAAIAAFAQKHPEVRIDVRIVGSATAADLVTIARGRVRSVFRASRRQGVPIHIALPGATRGSRAKAPPLGARAESRSQ